MFVSLETVDNAVVATPCAFWSPVIVVQITCGAGVAGGGLFNHDIVRSVLKKKELVKIGVKVVM